MTSRAWEYLRICGIE